MKIQETKFFATCAKLATVLKEADELDFDDVEDGADAGADAGAVADPMDEMIEELKEVMQEMTPEEKIKVEEVFTIIKKYLKEDKAEAVEEVPAEETPA